MNPSVEQLHLDILSLCLKLKSKGHDAFYSYSAHVNWARVNVFIGGWDDEKEPDTTFDFLPTEEYDLELKNCKDYLQNLLDGE